MEEEQQTKVTLLGHLKKMHLEIIGGYLLPIVKILRDPDNLKKMKNMSDDDVVKELMKIGFKKLTPTVINNGNASGGAKAPSKAKEDLLDYASGNHPNKSASASKTAAQSGADNLSITKWLKRTKKGELLCGHAKRVKKDSGLPITVCSSLVFNPTKTDKPEFFRCCDCKGKIGVLSKELTLINGEGTDKVKVGSHNKVNNNIPSRPEAPDDDEDALCILGKDNWYMFGEPGKDYEGFVFFQNNGNDYCIGKYLNEKKKPIVKNTKDIKNLKNNDNWRENLNELTKSEIKELAKVHKIKYVFNTSFEDLNNDDKKKNKTKKTEGSDNEDTKKKDNSKKNESDDENSDNKDSDSENKKKDKKKKDKKDKKNKPKEESDSD